MANARRGARTFARPDSIDALASRDGCRTTSIPELAPADRGLRNEGVLRPLAMQLARREPTAPVQCAAAAIGIIGRDCCTVARGDAPAW